MVTIVASTEDKRRRLDEVIPVRRDRGRGLEHPQRAVPPELVAAVDAEGVIGLLAGDVEGILGADASELVGRPVAAALETVVERFAEPGAFRAAARRVLASPERVHENELALADGRMLLHRSLPVAGDPSGCRIVLLRDVTAERFRGRRFEALLGELIQAEENERARVAGELHDGPVQVLAAALLRLESLADRLARDAASLVGGVAGGPGALTARRYRPAAETRELLEALREAYREARTLLFDLKPLVLEEEGLAAAVGELLGRLEREQGIEAALDDELPERPPQHLELIACRVIQEALQNVRRHARARRIVVTLRWDGGLSCEVRDNGLGFDPDAPKSELAPRSYGLASMRERVELAGGKLELRTAPGTGTALRFTLPPAP